MRTFSTVPSGMRARSKTSASGSGLPAGSTMRAEYVPPDELASRLSSTRGSPANRGETDLDTGSDGGGGASAVCLGTGVLVLGRAVSVARDRRAAPGAADDPGEPLLSNVGAPASRDGSTLAASRGGAGSGGDAGPRSGRSTWGVSVAGARAGASVAGGLSAMTGARACGAGAGFDGGAVAGAFEEPVALEELVVSVDMRCATVCLSA